MRKTYKIKRVNKKKGGGWNDENNTVRVKFLSDTFSENGTGSLIKILNYLTEYSDTGLKKKLSSNPRLFEELQIPITVDDSSLQKLEFEIINTDGIKKIEKDDGSTDGSSTDVSTDGSDGSDDRIPGKTYTWNNIKNTIKSYTKKSDTKKSYYAIPKNIDDLIEIVKYINSEIQKLKGKKKGFTSEDEKTLNNADDANIQITKFLRENLSSYEDTLITIKKEYEINERKEKFEYGGAKYKNTRKRNKTHKSKK